MYISSVYCIFRQFYKNDQFIYKWGEIIDWTDFEIIIAEGEDFLTLFVAFGRFSYKKRVGSEDSEKLSRILCWRRENKKWLGIRGQAFFDNAPPKMAKIS